MKTYTEETKYNRTHYDQVILSTPDVAWHDKSPTVNWCLLFMTYWHKRFKWFAMPALSHPVRTATNCWFISEYFFSSQFSSQIDLWVKMLNSNPGYQHPSKDMFCMFNSLNKFIEVFKELLWCQTSSQKKAVVQTIVTMITCQQRCKEYLNTVFE